MWDVDQYGWRRADPSQQVYEVAVRLPTGDLGTCRVELWRTEAQSAYWRIRWTLCDHRGPLLRSEGRAPGAVPAAVLASVADELAAGGVTLEPARGARRAAG